MTVSTGSYNWSSSALTKSVASTAPAGIVINPVSGAKSAPEVAVPDTLYATSSAAAVSPERVNRTTPEVAPASVAVPSSTVTRTIGSPDPAGAESITSAKGCGPCGTL